MAAEETKAHGLPSSNQAKSKKNKKQKAKKQNGRNVMPNGALDQESEDKGEQNGVDDEDEEGTKSDEDNADTHGSDADDMTSTSLRLEAAARERDQLRVEVTEIRKSLESIQKKHEDEKTNLTKQVEDAKIGKDHADSRYQKLLGQVNTIKSTLHDRLKADAEELAKANSRIGELEEDNKTQANQAETLQNELQKVREELEQQTREMSSVRDRTNTSQQNWSKEREDLLERESRVRKDFEAARQAMQDWEVLALEERNLREGAEERVSELEEQLNNQTEVSDRASAERETQNTTIDGLQRALREVHDARKDERRELVESYQGQLDEVRRQATTAEISLKQALEDLEHIQTELRKALPFEKEVKEKNLLIGKLRQEAIILNDHLTKALRFLKRGKKDDQVDRQLVTNYLLHFFALDRTDPKKFQVLQLISSILGWTEEQQEQAGLARPGASTSTSLKIPLSTPFRRVSSSATLSPLSPQATSTWSASGDSAGRESLAELWSDFLEREAEESAAKSDIASPKLRPTSSTSGK